MLGPRVKRAQLRVGIRCGEDECDCSGSLSNALIIAAATVAFQAAGEVIVKRLTANAELVQAVAEKIGTTEEPSPARKRRAK